MLQTLTTFLELVGFALVTVGAWLRWGEAVGLMFSGAACVIIGYLASKPAKVVVGQQPPVEP